VTWKQYIVGGVQVNTISSSFLKPLDFFRTSFCYVLAHDRFISQPVTTVKQSQPFCFSCLHHKNRWKSSSSIKTEPQPLHVVCSAIFNHSIRWIFYIYTCGPSILQFARDARLPILKKNGIPKPFPSS